MSKSLRFKELQLEGFGPYQDKTRFVFEEGVNAYVAENETGKSTMAFGVLAVLFGLPHGTSQDGFDFSRFKNLKVDRHSGELLLEVNSDIYGVKRNFQNHEVIFWRVNKSDEKEVLLEGNHNPRAKKPFKAYEEAIGEIFGIGDQSLFEHTFFVGQPLPEAMEISREVQSLIIGKRGSSLSGLLDQLVKRLKTITRYTGPNDLGITTRNMGKDGNLEKVSQSYDEIKESFEKGKETAEQLVEVQKALFELQQDLSDKGHQYEEKTRTYEALSIWETLKREYERLSIERNRLKNLLKIINIKQSDREALKKELKKDFPEFQEVNDEIEKDLRTLINESEKRDEHLESLQIAKENHDEVLREKKEVEKLLNTFEGWGRLGSDPVEKLKTSEKTLQKMIGNREEAKGKEERLEGLEELLVNEYTLFEKADEETLELLENYREELLTRKSEMEKAIGNLKKEEAQSASLEEAKEELKRHYGELIDFPDEGLKAVNDKIPLIQREKELQEKILQEKSGNRMVKRFLPLLVFLIGGLGWLTFDVIGGIAGFIIGLILGMIVKRRMEGSEKPLKSLEREMAELKDKIDSMDRVLGSYSSCDTVQLTRLSESLKQKKRWEEKIRERLELVDDSRINDLREKAREEQRKLNEFEDRTDPYKRIFEAPHQSLRTWKKHRETMKNLREQLKEFYERHFEKNNGDLWSRSFKEAVKDHEWKDIYEILAIIDPGNQFTDGMSVEEFFKEASTLDFSWWKDRREKGRIYYDAIQNDRSMDQQLNTLSEKILRQKEKLESLRDHIKQLREKWDTPLNANEEDPGKTLSRFQESVDKQREIIQLNNDIHNLLEGEGKKSVAELEQIVSLKEDEAGIALGKWKDHLTKHPELPDISEEHDRVAMMNNRKKLREEIDDLDITIKELESLKLNLRSRQAFLEGSEPINLAAGELELQELENERKSLELRRDALALAYREMEEAIKDYRQTYQENLEKVATDYCRKISEKKERSIAFGDNMEVVVKEDGREVSLQSLSKGARDQLFLSLRFAIADLLSEELKLPFIFDDPFVGTDKKRLERIREAVEKQSRDRQIFILSHQNQYRDWGNEIEVK